MEWVNLFEVIWLEAKYQDWCRRRGIHVHRKAWWRACRKELLEQSLFS